VNCLGFGAWGTQGSGWRGLTCVKNLSRVGVEVCAKFDGDGSGIGRYKQSLLYIEIHTPNGTRFIHGIYEKHEFIWALPTD